MWHLHSRNSRTFTKHHTEGARWKGEVTTPWLPVYCPNYLSRQWERSQYNLLGDMSDWRSPGALWGPRMSHLTSIEAFGETELEFTHSEDTLHFTLRDDCQAQLSTGRGTWPWDGPYTRRSEIVLTEAWAHMEISMGTSSQARVLETVEQSRPSNLFFFKYVRNVQARIHIPFIRSISTTKKKEQLSFIRWENKESKSPWQSARSTQWRGGVRGVPFDMHRHLN